MQKELLAIDLGGTNCRFILSSKPEEIIIKPSPQEPHELVKLVIKTSKDLDFDLIKVAAAGFWDQEQILKQSHNLPQYINYPIWQEISQKLNCKIEVYNDMQVAAIGEAIFGQQNKYSNLLYLNLGTGIGASFYDGSKVMSRIYSPCLRLDLKPNPQGVFYSKSKSTDIQESVETLTRDLIDLALLLSPEIITIGGGKAEQYWDSVVSKSIRAALLYLETILTYPIKIEKACLKYPALYGLLKAYP